MRHQRQLATQSQLLRTTDRLLCGTLVACDAVTQRETLADYFEIVQELRVAMQRLESLLDARIGSTTRSDPVPVRATDP